VAPTDNKHWGTTEAQSEAKCSAEGMGFPSPTWGFGGIAFGRKILNYNLQICAF